MNRFTLSFFDTSLENNYQKEIYPERVKKLARFILLQDLIVIIFQIKLLTVDQRLSNYIMLVLAFLLITVIFILIKRSSSFLMIILMTNYIGSIIMYVELIHIFKEEPYLVVLIIPYQIMHSIMIFIKSKWINCSLIYMFSLIHLFFRVINTSRVQNVNFSTVILNFCIYWMFYTFIAYDQEKNYKKVYKKIGESYEKVNYFKLIMKNVIPSPIFIIDYQNDQIKFNNNSGINIIKMDKKKQDFSCFQNYLKKFVIFGEKSRIIENTTNPEIEVSTILKNYYNDETNHPFKSNVINEQEEQESKFTRINVWTNDEILKNNDSLDMNYNLNEEPKNKYYEIKILKIFWEDSICLFLLFNDNTHVFQISELVNQDLYKNQVLASVSHDLRTPLNGLNGMLELSIAKTEDPILRDYLELAQKSAFFLNYLINDILDFSLMNFKKMRLNCEEINLQQIIDEMLTLIEFQAKEKKIILKFYSLSKKQHNIFSDSTRIKQILLNLLSNALKFTDLGSIEVFLEDFTEDLTFPLYKISVKDSGVGIKPEDISKLCKLFGRLENNKKINKTGIGLGLTISKKISKLLCPEKEEGLQVDSIYGKGSTFYFFISSLKIKEKKCAYDLDSLEERCITEPYPSSPCRFLEETEILKTIQSERNIILKKILVVDDDLMNLMVAEQYLKLFNIKSLKAMNGLQAYKLIKMDYKSKTNEICMIIMDCNMPILDGFQASLKINKFFKKKGRRKIPILAVTANTTAADILVCKDSGMDYFLEKPMKKDDLKGMIEKILKLKI